MFIEHLLNLGGHSHPPIPMDTHIWDVYAKNLFPLGFGYPLWKPDPAPGHRGVEIGDVGRLERGEFRTLFSTMQPDTAVQAKGVPEGYVQFATHPGSIHGPREEIMQPIIHSRTIRRLDASAGLTVSPSLPRYVYYYTRSGQIDWSMFSALSPMSRPPLASSLSASTIQGPFSLCTPTVSQRTSSPGRTSPPTSAQTLTNGLVLLTEH